MKKINFLFGIAFLVLICNTSFSREYYVSVLQGNDTNAGTFSSPLKTISYTVSQMQKGDICLIREGIYRETINIDKDNLTLKAYNNEHVLITGCQLVKKDLVPCILSTTNNPCFRVPVNGKIHDVFVNGKIADLARFPDKKVEMLSNLDWTATYISDSTGYIEFRENLPKIFGQIKDGFYIGIHTNDKIYNNKGIASWCTFSAPIYKSIDRSLIVERDKASSGYLGKSYGVGNGLGYILGSKEVLDAFNEWYSDSSYLYIILPEDVNPKMAIIETRQCLYILNINGANTTVENIHFKAGSMLVSTDGNSIKNCTFRYITPFVHNPNPSGNTTGQSVDSQWGLWQTCSAGVYLKGNKNKITNCYFSKSWSSGLTISGDNNLVENSVIEDVNWIGRRSAGINSLGQGNIIRYCTIRNTGASSIEGGNNGWLNQYAIGNIWEHNYFGNACRLIVDQAFIYVNHQLGNKPKSNTIIRYNLGENVRGPEKGKWSSTCVGIYTDNNSSGYVIHNNVIINAKEGYRYNDFADGEIAGRDVFVYNNTFYLCDVIGGISKNSPDAVFDAKVSFFNNISVGPGEGLLKTYSGKDGKNNYASKNNYEKLDVVSVENPVCKDFTLKGNAKMLKGIPVDIYNHELDNNAKTINYVGAIDPDKGQFRFGASLSEPDFSFEMNLLTH